jgi:hypothetical protein
MSSLNSSDQTFSQVLPYASRSPRIHIQRLLPPLRNTLTAFALAISATAPIQAVAAEGKNHAPAGADPTVVEFLVTSAAKDFKASGGNPPAAIRAARIGYFAESGKGNFLLCGSFKSGPGTQQKWTHFATIKTSDYEQWIGGTAKAYCEQRIIKWYQGDHSTTVMQRLKE